MKKTITLKSSKSKSLNGIITVPSDKSISIRSLIISSTCLGNTRVFKLLESEDVQETNDMEIADIEADDSTNAEEVDSEESNVEEIVEIERETDS